MEELIQVMKILSKDEVNKINKYIDTLDFCKNSVFGKDDGPSTVNEDIRSSVGSAMSEDAEETKILHNAMNDALIKYKKRCQKIHPNFGYAPMIGAQDTVSWREGLQVLEYQKGQKYNFHHDAATSENIPEYHRKISIITYLKNAEEGGGTLFPHTGFKPSPGYALIFPSNWCYPHSGEPVTKGKKRVAVTWYYVRNRVAK